MCIGNRMKSVNAHSLTPNPCRARDPMHRVTVSQASRVRFEIPAPPSPQNTGEGSVVPEMAHSHFSGN